MFSFFHLGPHFATAPAPIKVTMPREGQPATIGSIRPRSTESSLAVRCEGFFNTIEINWESLTTSICLRNASDSCQKRAVPALTFSARSGQFAVGHCSRKSNAMSIECVTNCLGHRELCNTPSIEESNLGSTPGLCYRPDVITLISAVSVPAAADWHQFS
jgi:hypothetical protein